MEVVEVEVVVEGGVDVTAASAVSTEEFRLVLAFGVVVSARPA